MGAGQVGTAAAVNRGRFNGAGGTGRREEFAEETDPRVLEVYNFDSLGLNKEGFQKNEQTL